MTELARRALPSWAGEFARFGSVGAVGFVANVATVYALRGAVGLYAAGLAAYLVAATVTWALNRAWTFQGRSTLAPHRQWVLFLLANSLGFALYYGTYVALVSLSPACAAHPVLAVFGGMLAGMFANFALSRAYVFR